MSVSSEYISEARWEDFLERSSGATFFHGYKWRDVLAKGLGIKPLYLTLRNDAGEIEGVFPSFIIESNHAKTCVSLPFSDYGGPITMSKEASARLYQGLFETCADSGITYLRMCLTEPSYMQGFRSKLCCVDKGKGVTEINLVRTKPEFIWNCVFKGTTRNRLRSIDKSSFQAYELTSECELHGFYRIYALNMRRVGASPLDYRFLLALWQTLYPKNVRIWLIGKNNPVGGILFLKNHKASYGYQFGFDKEHSPKCSIMQYVVWKETLKAVEEGIEMVSLGSSSSVPEERHHQIKIKCGGTFRQQEVVWLPTTLKGTLLLQLRCQAANLWRLSNRHFPRESKSVMKRLKGLIPDAS